VRQQVEPLARRIAELEAREHQLKYCCTWQPAASYQTGIFTTFDGSLWHANRVTRAKPGTSDEIANNRDT